MEPSISEQVTILSRQIKRRHEKLRQWARREGVQAYRLYDREIPSIPLTVDLYGKYLHVSAMLKPGEKAGEVPKGNGEKGEAERWLNTMSEAIARAVGLPLEHLFIKRRRGGAGYEPAGEPGKAGCIDIEEGGLLFEVDLEKYMDTGLFLDHRSTRGFVREISRGAAMLNLFSYTGSFSVYAAHGGARTTSVDMSNTYSRWAARNMEKNGFIVGALHTIVTENVLSWLKKAVKKREHFDIIVCDPPTFSNSNKMSRPFSIQKDHVWLIQSCMDLLTRGGLLVFSCNFRQFKLGDKELSRHATIEEITRKTIPPDFAKRKPHRCWIIQRR